MGLFIYGFIQIMGLFKIICWALIFLTRLPFPPGSSIVLWLWFLVKNASIKCHVDENKCSVYLSYTFIQGWCLIIFLFVFVAFNQVSAVTVLWLKPDNLPFQEDLVTCNRSDDRLNSNLIKTRPCHCDVKFHSLFTLIGQLFVFSFFIVVSFHDKPGYLIRWLH